MILLTALSLSAADFDALDAAVQRCDRNRINPVFAGEAERHSQFVTEAYREQEALVAARLDLANRKRALREAGVSSVKGGDSLAELETDSAAVEDRQRALNDRRMLEGMRTDAMDAKRRYYLARCASGKE